MTVAEGYVQAVWTFNGTVPGPVIRVHQGDKIRVQLVNPATSKLEHSVDFHASQVAWNDEMTSIKPGEEKIYEWTADYAGVWMYHCGTAPALHHIANGMYGMVIVEPKGGFKPVDHEFAFVQSEWYLGPQGDVTDLTKAAAGAPAPDFVVFNGVANQYKDNPLKVETGKSRPGLRPRRRAQHRQLVPHRRHDLQHGHQGRHPADAQERRPLRLAGRGPVAGTGRDHRVHDRRGRPLPDGHPRLQLRRPRCPGPLPGRRRRPQELARRSGRRSRGPIRRRAAARTEGDDRHQPAADDGHRVAHAPDADGPDDERAPGRSDRRRPAGRAAPSRTGRRAPAGRRPATRRPTRRGRRPSRRRRRARPGRQGSRCTRSC